MTSVITYNEIFKYQSNPESLEKFEKVFNRPQTIRVNVDFHISKLGRELRIHFNSLNQNIRLADSIHLATAIQYDLDEFHTYDDKLLNKNGKLMHYNLKLCKPNSPANESF